MLPVEVTLLTHLPLGKSCTLQPTNEAIRNGFYNLKNVKLALEQSIIRTRGSLNVGDIMHCWFRGKKFDLNVKNVSPPDVGAISCVNCDIEVDIAPPPSQDENDMVENKNDGEHKSKSPSRTSSGGYRLSDDPVRDKEKATHKPIPPNGNRNRNRNIDLPPEPPADQRENVISVQIRSEGKASQRRFATSSSLKQLFDFVVSEGLINPPDAPFKLVTRFPRRVFKLDSADEELQLNGLGLSKQEAFIVEK